MRMEPPFEEQREVPTQHLHLAHEQFCKVYQRPDIYKGLYFFMWTAKKIHPSQTALEDHRTILTGKVEHN